ncbi:MAG: guanylate kinase [Alphaproteobacteria bacterium]|nr:guanylate kinase [Alphaproteobacteria bacterium]
MGEVLPQQKRRGLLFVLSSPSGAGKTTLGRRLLEGEGPALRMSVSLTTRPARPGETDGEDYWFVDEARFGELREQGGLLEWAQVFGNYYGTPRKQVEASLAAGHDVLFDVDWQGARQLAEAMADDVVRVFILPPSAQILESRLTSRNQDSAEVVALRMAQASGEISHWNEYDYVVVNQEIDRSIMQLQAILAAERLKRVRQTGLTNLVEDLQRALGQSVWH